LRVIISQIDNCMQKFWGIVRHGKKRGKALGYPTANVNLSKKIPEGIYVSQTKFEGKVYQSATFIGVATTFNERAFLSETFILDFDREIYGEWISVTLLKKIRDNQKFESVEKLIDQISKDVDEIKKYFN
jgi:riboflavin kinase/FMN adenylyltransferase